MTNERHVSAPVTHGSLTVPLMLALAAPLAVIVCILYLHSVWWTFAVYQVGICLVAPALESRLAGRTWREHAALLGLSSSPESDGPPRLKILAVGLGLGTALVTGGFLVLTRDRFLDPELLEATVAGWGVAPEQMVTMLGVMAVLNAAAEEFFWRGYFPGRVATVRPGSSPPVALTVVLPSVLYASYHAMTIGHQVGETMGVVLMTGGVLGAGLIWAWLRRITGSVWPALLSHSGAVIAYLAVHYWLIAAGGD